MAGAALAVLAAAGCDGAGADPAPGSDGLRLGGEPGEACVPVRAAQSMLIGDVVTAGSAAATITGVQLKGANGVRLVDSFLLPATGDLIGTSTFPPEDSDGWRERVPAAGAVLRAETSYNLVVQVVRTGEGDGSASALTISYSSSPSPATGTNDEVEGSTRYRFAARCF